MILSSPTWTTCLMRRQEERKIFSFTGAMRGQVIRIGKSWTRRMSVRNCWWADGSPLLEGKRRRRKVMCGGRVSSRIWRMGRYEITLRRRDGNAGAERYSLKICRKFTLQRRRWSAARLLCCLLIVLAIIILTVAIALIVRVFTRPVVRHQRLDVPLTSNGTHSFQPTVLLISLDGFRPDYLDLGVTPNLNQLKDSGVAPPYMKPSFPSVTFPNVPLILIPLTKLALYHCHRAIPRKSRRHRKVISPSLVTDLVYSGIQCWKMNSISQIHLTPTPRNGGRELPEG